MFLKVELNPRLLSQFLLGTFSLILGVSIALSEFFQAPKENIYDVSKYNTLVSEEMLAQVVKVEFKNRLGSFKFELQNHDGRDEWQMISPRSFPANQDSLFQIFDALKRISIRRIYERDKININNFSLDYPLMAITLHQKDGTKTSIDLGLINPVDSSTYVSISNQSSIIYHINALENALEKFDLANFVESRIFHLKRDEIASLKISNSGGMSILQLTKKDDNWFGRGDAPMENEKVVELINELLAIRSQIIIDRMPEGAKETLTKAMGSQLYTVTMTDTKGDEYTYNFSNLLPAIADLKLEKYQNIIVSSSKRRFPYILSKDILNSFTKINEAKMKKIPFKKLFY
ncbi:MAG: hypothetical protein Fur0010_21360 [Bdellovibrio sp.]